MRKIAGAVFASVFLVAACGGASAPAATATTNTKTAAPTVAATSAPTQQATQPAATAAATSAATSTPASGAMRKIPVTATNSLYSIATLEVKAGEKIEFVLTNTGDEKHNLVGVGDGISILSPDFDAGQTVSWIWTAPTKFGTFKLICAYHKEIPPVMVTVK